MVSLLAVLVLAGASANAANLTVGNIIVERIGDGTTTLSSAATGIAVLEYTTTGTAVQTITFPTTGSSQQTDAGSASSNGYLNSYNGFVAVTGYNNPAATASVTSQNTKVTSIIDSTGNVANRVTYPTGGPSGTPPSPFSGNNLRSAIATGSNTFYASGQSAGVLTGGVWYYNGTAFTQVSATPSNARNVEIYGNQLFFSFRGVYSVGTGLPTTSGQTATSVINVGGSAETYGFVFFDTNNDTVLDRAYLTDDRTSNTAGGISRFDFSGGNWSQTGTAFRFDTASSMLTTDTATSGGSLVAIRGLSGSYDSATDTATLFATTTETSNNRLISFLDTGSLSTSTAFTTLQSAGANFVFRGVDINTIPEPSSLSLLLAGGAVLMAGRRRNRG